MANLITGLSAARVRDNLLRVREQIAAAAARAGRDPDGVEVLAAIKYLPAGELPALAEAGVTLVGENRAQDLVARTEAFGSLFEWDFIGALQSNKIRLVLPRVRLIHSLASESSLRELAKHAHAARPDFEALVEVNIAAEPDKQGIEPAMLGDFIARCPVRVGGLMTMPPLASDPELSRPAFAALRALADQHGLARLSMGTTQDFAVAVEEGATIVRIGTRLFT